MLLPGCFSFVTSYGKKQSMSHSNIFYFVFPLLKLNDYKGCLLLQISENAYFGRSAFERLRELRG